MPFISKYFRFVQNYMISSFSLFLNSTANSHFLLSPGGQHCKIAPLCNVPTFSTLPDYTVVYGNNERRLEQPGLEPLKAEGREKQIEVLKALAAAAAKAGRS